MPLKHTKIKLDRVNNTLDVYKNSTDDLLCLFSVYSTVWNESFGVWHLIVSLNVYLLFRKHF